MQIDPKNPIPFESDQWSFTTNGEAYIPFFPPKDDFFKSIIEAKTLSVTHGACISTKTNYTLGKGLIITNLKEGQKADPRWTDLMKSCNANGSSFNSVIGKVIESFFTAGNAPIEIVRGSFAGKKFVNIYRKNILDCRLEWPKEGESDPRNAIYSRTFRNKGFYFSMKNAKTIPLYRRGRKDNWMKDGPVERSMIWLKNEMVGFDWYGIPSAIASLLNQMLEYGGARYNLDNLENNMVVSAVLTLAGNLTEQEATRISRSLIKQHTGAGKRGRIAVVASESGISDSKLDSLDTHKDGSYKEMSEEAESKIILANEWDSVLAGLKSSNSLGKGAGYLEEIYNQKYQTVIRPVIDKILEQVISPLLEIYDEWFGTTWSKDYVVDFAQVDLSTKNTELNTTAKGIEAFFDIVKMVAAGIYEQDAAVKLIMKFFGWTEQETQERLGTIKVTGPDVLKTATNKKDANNA